MHELSIAESVVDAVLERTAGRPLTTVRLQVGRLSGVVPDALQFCFELATAGTPLEGAGLEVDEPTGRAHCRECNQDFEVDDLILLCHRGSADVEVVAGRELQVMSVEVVQGCVRPAVAAPTRFGCPRSGRRVHTSMRTTTTTTTAISMVSCARTRSTSSNGFSPRTSGSPTTTTTGSPGEGSGR